MYRRSFAIALVAAAIGVAPALAGPKEELSMLYQRFVAAQNNRDLGAVREALWDAPEFLWVSDGMSVWGRDALVKRMSGFQKAEVWRAEPDLARSTAVVLSDQTAYLHLPLVLTIGPGAKPDRLSFLASVLGIETPLGWRIAALFTTSAKSR